MSYRRLQVQCGESDELSGQSINCGAQVISEADGQQIAAQLNRKARRLQLPDERVNTCGGDLERLTKP